MNTQKSKLTSDQTEVQSKLDAIADDFLFRCREGDKPNIDEYTAKHPEIADQVKTLLQTLKFVDKFRDDTSVGSFKIHQQPNEIALGSRIGNYEILEQIGAGGMGVVFKSIHHNLKRTVALKVLSATRLTEDELARFEREMSVSGQLDSPNIVATHDGGNADGFHFIAMELVEGSDLGKIATANAPLSVGSASELIRQAALGLQQAHEIGLVHRDIKPSNLMLSNDGVVKILDLGLAKIHSDFEQHELTQSQQIMGTVDYIASEQCKDSRAADIRSDIYSLGATLCKLLTGETPYSGPSMNTTFEKLTALATVNPVSVVERRSDLPIEIINIVDKMTRRDPNERFQLPSEVSAALEPFADSSYFPLLLEKASHIVDESPSGRLIARSERETSRARLTNTIPDSLWQSGPAPNEPVKLLKLQNQSTRSRVPFWWTVAATCLIVLSGIAYGVVQKLKIVTPGGNMVVCTEGGETVISVVGKTASFIDPADGKNVSVSIDRENKRLSFSKEGFKAVGKKFELEKHDQKVTITFEVNETANVDLNDDGNAGQNIQPFSNTFNAPAHAIAAFQDPTGYSFVFYSKGGYQELEKKTDRVVHHIPTRRYWSHVMLDERDLLLVAAITMDVEHSMIFYSDGMRSIYHNPTTIELKTGPMGDLSTGETRYLASDIAAAVGWPDQRRFVFFKDGMCTRFDESMKPIETKQTITYFPNLDGKANLLSAARVDPSTQLAYFYFRDGTFQVYDSIENEVLGQYPLSGDSWSVAPKYRLREKPPTLMRRSKRDEVVNWCFGRGLVELECHPAGGTTNLVHEFSEWDRQLMPVTGITIDPSVENAHRTLRSTIKLAGRHLKKLVFESQLPVTNEFLNELIAPSVTTLELNCPILPKQMADIPEQGIENLSTSFANNKLLTAAANRFPNLRTVTINKSPEAGDNESNLDVESFRQSHPKIKVVVTE